MLHSIAIYSKENNQKTRDGVSKLVEEFCKRKIKILLFQKKGDTQLCEESEYLEKFSDMIPGDLKPDIILSVGGDGTFLETVMKVKDLDIPVAGVNTGRMGFLANIPNEDISHSVDMLCQGEYEILERCTLDIVRPNGIFEGESSTALNEITIHKANPSMITIHVTVDDTFLNTYWADGLIISTATGSTAYNLSVGGPILTPEDESIIISPISPHNLTIRPIILSGKRKLKMVVEGRTTGYLATCDFRSRHLPFSEEIHIVKSETKLKTVMLRGKDFYSTLRNKLMWGVDKRN